MFKHLLLKHQERVS